MKGPYRYSGNICFLSIQNFSVHPLVPHINIYIYIYCNYAFYVSEALSHCTSPMFGEQGYHSLSGLSPKTHPISLTLPAVMLPPAWLVGSRGTQASTPSNINLGQVEDTNVEEIILFRKIQKA
jgi:hypothetical protein